MAGTVVRHGHFRLARDLDLASGLAADRLEWPRVLAGRDDQAALAPSSTVIVDVRHCNIAGIAIVAIRLGARQWPRAGGVTRLFSDAHCDGAARPLLLSRAA